MALVSLETAEKETKITSVLSFQTSHCFWTSGVRVPGSGAPGRWMWGTSGKAFTYTNWAPTEPNMAYPNENYLGMTNGMWYDIRPSVSCLFICENDNL